MNKRITAIILVLACLLVLSGCGCEHEWQAATCDAPSTCALCGKTEGEPAGHSWQAATCSAPKTCSSCHETEGEALSHNWTAATCDAPETCETCGATKGEPLGHSWLDATYEAPKTCETCGATEGEPLTQGSTDFTASASYLLVQQLINESMADMNPQYEYNADSGIFYISLTAPDGTAYAIATNPGGISDSWATLSSSLCSLTTSATTLFSSDGFSEVSCCIMLLNDTNTDNVLLGILNGAVIYDIMAQ